jgi:DNA-binding IclR family transcriptional regulator
MIVGANDDDSNGLCGEDAWLDSREKQTSTRENALGAPQSLRSVDSRSPAVTRAVALVEELARQRRPVGIAELARSLDLAKSTIANLCAALEGTHMIRRVDGGWALGYKVVELGQAFLAGTDVVQEFRRAAGTLPVGGRETVLLAVLDGVEVVYLARHDGKQPVRLASDIGARMPAGVTALGKAMLASLPDDELADRLSRVHELPALTAKSHRTLDALRRDLDETRERGYAVDDEQNTAGVTCVSVALPGGVEPPTAVSATLLTARLTKKLRGELVSDLTTLAGLLSRTAAL